MLVKRSQQTVRHPPGLILILGTLQVVDKDTIGPEVLFWAGASTTSKQTPRAKGRQSKESRSRQ